MEKPEQIWFLLSRNLSGEATPEEKEALQEALRQQPALMQQYELLQRLWRPDKKPGTEEIAEKVNHILERSARETAERETGEVPAADRRRIPFFPRRVWPWAAVVAGLSLAIWMYAVYTGKPRREANEIIAKKGSKTRTLLPDGSTVWLNAGSSILFDPEFTGPTREVTLQGEAYFDIVRQPDKPFIVHAGDINIRVLGTAFNVKSYAEEPTVETTLIRGLVQITRDNAKEGTPIYLHPHQKIVLPRNIVIEETQVNTAPVPPPAIKGVRAGIVYLDSSLRENEHLETAWLYNRLEFRGDQFSELAKKLERWYNITIHFEDEAVRNLVFNGSLENETVEQAFFALTAAASFQFEIKGNEVFIRSQHK